jgi:hypothetical protein
MIFFRYWKMPFHIEAIIIFFGRSMPILSPKFRDLYSYVSAPVLAQKMLTQFTMRGVNRDYALN